ncbi:MAG: XdhC family protein, partial [Longimicrobiales bacterium]
MTEHVAPIDVARLAERAESGGEAVAAVLCVAPARYAGARLVRFAGGRLLGTLGHAELDTAARTLATRALTTREPAFTETVRLSGADATLYVESFHAPEQLVVVGAGHIAVPLARHGVALGFRVTVLDDREEFATADRFPAEATVLRTDFESDPFAALTIG